MPTNLRDLYKCNICGNVIEIVNTGAPALFCCNKPMKKLDPKTGDAGTEKHTPVIENIDGGIRVNVGSVEHPMEEKHHIGFIEVLTENTVLRAELKPDQKPQAEFAVAPSEVIEVRSYCNLHGLWKDK